MNCDCFNWTAFSAIIEAISAVLTLIAVIVALYQAKRPYRKHLKIRFVARCYFVSRDISVDYSSIEITNDGCVKVSVVEVGLLCNNGQEAIVYNRKELDDDFCIDLPEEMEMGDYLPLRIKKDSLTHVLKKCEENGMLKSNDRIEVFAKESCGKTFKYKTRIRVHTYIDNYSGIVCERIE